MTKDAPPDEARMSISAISLASIAEILVFMSTILPDDHPGGCSKERSFERVLTLLMASMVACKCHDQPLEYVQANIEVIYKAINTEDFGGSAIINTGKEKLN